MNTKIRFLIALFITLVIVALASNQVAWARFSPATADAVASRNGPTLSDKGTVRPPNCGGLTITKSGDYSLCAVAIIKADFKTQEAVQFLVSRGPKAPKEKEAGKVRAGPVVISAVVNGNAYAGPYDTY